VKTQKKYPLEKSPLFSIHNKNKLAELLRISRNELLSLASNNYYRVFPKKSKEKIRIIEEPIGLRKRVHKRIQNLLSRIETPKYLFSGQKGISFIDNAKFHIDNSYFIAVDIEGFYQNTEIEYIFRFFKYNLKMSDDLAWLFADIVTFENHIPTGSHLSQNLAYFSYSDLFNKINEHSIANNIRFSLYVDDMTFSCIMPISNKFHLSINYLLKNVNLHLKRKKIKYYSKNQYKKITGAIITPTHKLSIPNNKQKKIYDLKSSISINDPIEGKKLQQFLGLIRYGQQLNPNFYQNLYRTLRPLEKNLY
jgi:RNA-directed DNA polymerase